MYSSSVILQRTCRCRGLTPLHRYDNFTRSLRPFVPLQPGGEVGLYTCGPTVYDYQHIGNYRTFLFEDVLKRVLEWNGHRVRHVMNITDVGHLTSSKRAENLGIKCGATAQPN